MRAQTSLEFLLILSIISGLSLFALSNYNSTIVKSNQMLFPFTSFNSYQNPNTSSIPQESMKVAFYLPSNSTLGKSYELEVGALGCSSGKLDAHFSSNGVVFSNDNLSVNVNGINFGSIYFSPISSGYETVRVNYTYACDALSKTGVINLTTYSTSLETYNSDVASFQISPQNEFISYPLLNNGNVLGLTEFGHCTYANMFGPAGITSQCGTANAWEYSVFSEYCYSSSNYYTVTYCIVPYSTNYSLLSPDISHYQYKYSFDLSIYSQGANAKAHFSNSSLSNLSIENQKIGQVEVQKVSGNPPLQNINLIHSPHSLDKIPDQSYFSYSQAKNNLFASLQFYNNSMVSSDIQSSLEASLLSYSKSVNNLLNTTPETQDSCKMLDSAYLCNSIDPFYYTLIANISNSKFQNSTMNYQGSTLKIIRV